MRWKRRGVMRTASGAVITGATVQVFIAGGATPANIYEASSGGAQLSQVTADSQGRYEYYVDAADYDAATRFKEVITKGTTSTTLDNIPIVRWDPTVDQSLDGELTITGTGNGVTFPDGSRQTTNATPGAGVTNTGDVSIAADTDADGSGEITLSTQGAVRARVPNSGGLEINDSGAWRDVATLDGAETLSNKTLNAPTVGDFSNAAHDHSDAASGGALSAPTMTNPVLDGSLSGTAVLDEDDMASDSATQLATQQSIKAYVDTRPQLITEWSMPDDNHPYLNAENTVTRGKAAIKLPADKEAWVHGEFIANTTGQDINVDIDYMMSMADNDPVNWGLAYAVGERDLCAVPWEPSHTYTIGDRICSTEPNGCTYEMIEGTAGFGATDLCTGGTAIASGGVAANAFDGNTSIEWTSDLDSPNISGAAYIGYDLGGGNDTEVGKFRIYPLGDYGAAAGIDAASIQYSDDGNTWYTASDIILAKTATWQEFTFSGAGAHRYWRLLAMSNSDTGFGWVVGQIEMYELLGGTGVSAGGGFGETDLCTGGTASADSFYGPNTADLAVDDNTGTYWFSNTLMSAGGCWWQYDLGSGNEANIGKFSIRWYPSVTNLPTSFTIAGSNNASDWDTLYTGIPAGADQLEDVAFTNNTDYRYYRISAISGGDYGFCLSEVSGYESLGGSEPIWPSTTNAEITDNEITWKCVSTDNYDTLSLTGETAPSTAWTESTKTFTIAGAGISAGDPINILVIRQPGSSEHSGDLHLLRATHQAVEA